MLHILTSRALYYKSIDISRTLYMLKFEVCWTRTSFLISHATTMYAAVLFPVILHIGQRPCDFLYGQLWYNDHVAKVDTHGEAGQSVVWFPFQESGYPGRSSRQQDR